MILIALGSNMPTPSGLSPLAICRAAAGTLDQLPGLRLIALSGWYRTNPVPPVPGSAPYVNGVARLKGDPGDPARLLHALHAIEAMVGRERPYPNAPRTLDLDLIDLQGLQRTTPDPVLPHPRAHLRRFVLQPLRDVAPTWVHPVLGQDVETLLAALPPGDLPEPIGG